VKVIFDYRTVIEVTMVDMPIKGFKKIPDHIKLVWTLRCSRRQWFAHRYLDLRMSLIDDAVVPNDPER
jgi:hypothetical protein